MNGKKFGNFETNWEAVEFLLECKTAEELRAGGVDVVKISAALEDGFPVLYLELGDAVARVDYGGGFDRAIFRATSDEQLFFAAGRAEAIADLKQMKKAAEQAEELAAVIGGEANAIQNKILRHALSILEGLKELDYRDAWEANWYSAPVCLRAEFDRACRAFNEQLFTKESPGIFCDALAAYLEGESLAESIEQGGSKKKPRSL